MSDELEKLKTIAEKFKRLNRKVLLLGLLDKAQSEYDKYDFDSGEKTLLEAYNIDPNDSAVLRGLGCIEQFGKSNYEKALEYFFKALEFSEQKEVEYTLIGMVYYFDENLDDAVKYFNLAIDENDDYTDAYEGRNQAMLENHLRIIDLQESLKKYF